MAGRNRFRALLEGGIGKELEFDFLVAHDVWVWSISLLVFFQHVINNFLLVFFFEVKNAEVDAEFYGNAFCVSKILCPWTFHAWKILTPVLHIDANNLMALLPQKIGRDSRINATRHT